MDESGQRDSRRHRMDYYKVPPWNVISQYQIKEQNAFHVNTKLTMLCDERDAAIQERDRALHEKKIALDERDAAIHQRDAAMADRDNAIRERDNAIAALQFQESTMNALLHRPKHNVKSPSNLGEKFNPGAFPISAIPSQDTNKLDKVSRTKAKKNGFASSNKSPRKAKKINGDLNRHVTTDGTKAEWDAQDFGSMSQIQFNESTMPVPVCSCTGEARHCYKWGNGGWQSSCCTTSLSVYPLPQMPNKKHSRMGGRKMSGSVFSRLLTRLASAGHDLSTPVDLKNYWAKHGTNRYITIK